MFAEEFLEWDEAELERRKRLFKMGGFSPEQNAKVSGWIRLLSSTQSGGEWTSLIDVLNAGNPLPQVDTDRRAAVGASANGFPTLIFDATDMYPWALSNTINNMTTKLGFWFWYKPATVVGIQTLFSIYAGGGGASLNKFDFYQNAAALVSDLHITDANGRRATSAAALTAGAWHSLYWRYDSSLGGDPNYGLHCNAVATSPSFANIGAGGTLGALQQPTGTGVIGAFNNSDTPTQPIANLGELGPNAFAFNDTLTAGEITIFDGFEKAHLMARKTLPLRGAGNDAVDYRCFIHALLTGEIEATALRETTVPDGARGVRLTKVEYDEPNRVARDSGSRQT